MKKVLIILAEGFEEIEAVAPVDVLRRAGAEVCVAGLDNLIVKGVNDLMIKADVLLKDVSRKEFDLLILPGGGEGTQNLMKSTVVLDLVKDYYSKNLLVAAICAAPMVLAEAGVAEGHMITSYPGTEGSFKPEQRKLDKVVVSGNIITGKGPGAALEFGLKLAELLFGADKASETASAMVAK